MTEYWPKIITQIALLLNLFACAPVAQPPPTSETQGKGLAFFPRPRSLSASDMASFSAKFREFSSQAMHASAGAATADAAVNHAGAAYLKAVAQVGGVRREEGAEALKKIVSDPGESCGGASCARVLGIKKGEIDAFMDNLFFQASSLPNTPQRSVLVSSLTRERAFTNPVLPKDIVASIFLGKAAILPSSTYVPTGILSRGEFYTWSSADVALAVEQYTNMGFYAARRVETMTQSEALKEGIAPMAYTLWKYRVKLINEKLPSLPTVNVPVYRGLSEVPYETVANWVKKWRERQAIALGPNDKPALTSTTWDIKIAKEFLMLKLSSLLLRDEHLSVLLEIHNHRGVGIQNVSRYRKEHEVLIPATQRFRIDDIAPIGYFKRAIRIKLIGVESPAGQPGH